MSIRLTVMELQLRYPIMSRRPCQPDYILDAATEHAAVSIINEYYGEPNLMMFLLIALTYGFTSAPNLEKARGINYLVASRYDWDPVAVALKWSQVDFQKKAYDTNVSLTQSVASNNPVDGIVRNLGKLRQGIRQEVLDDLYHALAVICLLRKTS